MTRRRSARLVAAVVFAAFAFGDRTGLASPVVWQADDRRPIPQPAPDPEGDFIWWDGARSMTFYQLGRLLDLGESVPALGEWLGLVAPREARNRNALDEVPSSSWFTNRQGRRPLSRADLLRGPNLGPPPRRDGALVVRSGKGLGATPGFVFSDANDRKFLAKFDPPGIPGLATGAEVVCSKILWALGWNVPEYHLFALDPDRLEIAPDATIEDELNRERPMTRADLDGLLAQTRVEADGTIRTVASTFVPGVPIGPFSTTGVRADDPNDRIPHPDRRELRGLRVVAAWIDYTDARRGNFFDSFVVREDHPERHGHVVHYLLDFSSALGSGNTKWKPEKYGHEYFFDPLVVARSFVSFGFWVKPWEDPIDVEHPSLGTFDAERFDPRRWRTSYPQPLFDQATVRDLFWGAKLVWSLEHDDLRTIASTAAYGDPGATAALVELLEARRRKIAEAYFDAERLAPLDRFVVDRDRLTFEDLAVRSGVVAAHDARVRWRLPGGDWVASNDAGSVRLPASGAVELGVSHDGGRRWSPPLRIEVAPVGPRGGLDVIAIDRSTR